MKNGHFEEHWRDANGAPAGGVSCGRGFTITWQNGPLGPAGEGRKEPNGAFVEDVIAAVIGRIREYQACGFACRENETALDYLRMADKALDERTKRREKEGTEGTHQGS